MRTIYTGTFHTSDTARRLVNQVLDSERISYGELSKRFERRMAELHDCRYAILSNSGTSSLHVALQTLKELHGWADGDEVLVPATTFVATANVVIHNRLKPVLCDVERWTYGIDAKDDYPQINKRTRAIILVHLFGQPCINIEYAYWWRRAMGLAVIEDSCEAMFVTHQGQSVGSMGSIGCFSTYMAHLLTTGVGGIATTNNPDYAAKMRSLVNHGLSIANLNPDDNFAPRPMLNRRFTFDAIGHSFRITEFEAALGLAQLEDRAQMLRIRRRNAAQLQAGLKLLNNGGDMFHVPQTAEGNTHAWMMFPIILNHEPKDALCHWLNERGIETRDIPSLLYQPCYADYGWNPADFPVSDWLARNGFYVGCHQAMTPDDCQYILDALESYCHVSQGAMVMA